MKKIITWVQNNEFLVVVLIVFSILRIPTIFEPNWYGDEGIYLVLGQALRNGLVWYRDIHDNKPPLLYLLAAVAGSVAYFRALLLVWMSVTLVFFDKLARKLELSNQRRRIALVIFAILTTIPVIEGHIANAEIFMILPTILGVLLLLSAKRNRDFFLSGVCFSLAFLFKVPSIFEFLGIGLVFFVINQNKRNLWFVLKNKGMWIGIVGFFTPILVSLIYYFAVGAGKEYLIAAFLQNLGYLSSWRSGTIIKTSSSAQGGLLIRGLILLGASLIYWITNRKTPASVQLVWYWFIFALFGALLSERPYPHYLIQTVTALSILIAQINWSRKQATIFSILAIGTLGVAILRFKFYFYSTFGYYQNFGRYALRQISKKQYQDWFKQTIKQDEAEEVARYIKMISEKNDRIFVWSDWPFLYLMTDRLPATKYFIAYHVVDFDPEGVGENLRKNPPKIIVTVEDEKKTFSTLTALLQTEYVPVKKIGKVTIYLKMNSNLIYLESVNEKR